MSDIILQAPPLSRANIEQYADGVRAMMGVSEPRLPVAEFLEFVFPALKPQFTWDLRPRQEMENRHGLVDPHRHLLLLRDDVYDGMVDGRGRDRFTVCHEIAHALLHADMPLNRVRVKPKPYECPEWQANTFASAVLMPEEHVLAMNSVPEMTSAFGVSLEAAEVRLRVLKLRKPSFTLPPRP